MVGSHLRIEFVLLLIDLYLFIGVVLRVISHQTDGRMMVSPVTTTLLRTTRWLSRVLARLDEPIMSPFTPRLEQIVITSRCNYVAYQAHSPPSMYPSLRHIQELNVVSFPDLQAGNLNYTSMNIIDQSISPWPNK